MLVYRAELLKNSSGLTLLGILGFVVTSVIIGVMFFFNVNMGVLALLSFLIGMVLVLIGIVFVYRKTHISHFTI